MELQTLGDRVLRKLAFSHVIHSIRRMNQKHKNDANNRALQNILFVMLQVGNVPRFMTLQFDLFVVCYLVRNSQCCDSKKMKQKRNSHLLLSVIFIEGRCGLMIEQQTRYVQHAFIHHQGMHFFSWWMLYMLLPSFNGRKLIFILIFSFPRIMIAALSFLLDYENIVEDDEDNDGSSSEDDLATQQPHVLLNRESIYKVCCL